MENSAVRHRARKSASYAKYVIVALKKAIAFLNKSSLKMLVFFRFLKVLEGLGSSGMLVARISIGFHFNPPQDRAPTRPKIAPRRVQDRLGSVFLPLEFSLGFCIVFGSVLVPIWLPKWCPRDSTKLGLGGPLGV